MGLLSLSETRQLLAWLLVVCVALGITASISRAPVLALGFLLPVPIFILYSRVRIPLTILGLAAVFTAFYFQSQLVSFLKLMSNEAQTNATKILLSTVETWGPLQRK